MINRKVSGVLAALALMTATQAMAGDPPQSSVKIEKETVRFDDLDLHKMAGIATLHWRLRVAASNVCFQNDQGLRGTQLRRKCREAAIEQALTRVPQAITAYHAQWKASGASWSSQPLAPAQERLASQR